MAVLLCESALNSRAVVILYRMFTFSLQALETETNGSAEGCASGPVEHAVERHKDYDQQFANLHFINTPTLDGLETAAVGLSF